MNLSEEFQKSENKISALEQQNQELSKQLLNFQHLYYETKNENSSLHDQISRANECVAATKSEMEQYRARAQRILQEKERLLSLGDHIPADASDESNLLLTYNEELKLV